MYATMNSSKSTSEDGIGKHFYEQANQRINFLTIKFREKTVIILPQGTHKLKNPSFFCLKYISTKRKNVIYSYFTYYL